MCLSTEYLLTFDAYIGKNNAPDPDNYFAVGEEIVKNLLLYTSVPKNEGYKVYFDNCFTSYDLLQYLCDERICDSGTVRENRIKDCPPLKKYSLQKKRRSVKMVSTDKMMVIKYKDNSVLALASKFDSAETGTTEKNLREKKQISSILNQWL